MRHVILAVSTLVGTIIGVGMFGIPFAVAQAGVAPALFYFMVLGLITLVIHLSYGEVVLRTPEKHRLSGYAEEYLGRWGKLVAAGTFFVGLYGALLAYLVLGGEFLWLLLVPLLPGLTPITASLIVAAIGFLVVWRGLKAFGVFEVVMVALLFSLLLGLVTFGADKVVAANFEFLGPASALFLPYGIIFFALWGTSAIPEMRDFFTERPLLLKRSIVAGTLIPIIFYVLFTFVVVGITGGATTEEAIRGLSAALGGGFARYGALVGFLSVMTSFFTVSLIVEDSLRFDFHLSVVRSLTLAFGVPLVLFFLGARDFILIVGWVGAVLGAFEGMLILIMHSRAQAHGRRVPEFSISLGRFVRYGLVGVLLLSFMYQFIYVF